VLARNDEEMKTEVPTMEPGAKVEEGQSGSAHKNAEVSSHCLAST